MTGLLICALATGGAISSLLHAVEFAFERQRGLAVFALTLGLALIAVALWLAYAAGGA